MQFRAFLKRDQNSTGVTHQCAMSEGAFRAVVDATRQQKAREEEHATEQGQALQQASGRHALQRAVEECGRLVEFVRDVEEAVATGDMSAVQQRATEMRGAATGLFGLLRQLGGQQREPTSP